MANNAFIRQNDLNKYTGFLRTYVDGKIGDVKDSIGTVFRLRGTVASVDALPTEGVVAGDVYLVGAEGASSFDEYYYTNNNTYELMGTTAVSLDGLVSASALYAGADGTGTETAPAADSILGKLVSPIKTDVENIKTSLALAITDEELSGMFETTPSV